MTEERTVEGNVEYALARLEELLGMTEEHIWEWTDQAQGDKLDMDMPDFGPGLDFATKREATGIWFFLLGLAQSQDLYICDLVGRALERKRRREKAARELDNEFKLGASLHPWPKRQRS